MRTSPVLTFGHIDILESIAPGSGRIGGWIFRRDQPVHAIGIRIGGAYTRTELYDRPDVRAHFQSSLGEFPGMVRCGFHASVPGDFDGSPGEGTVVEIEMFDQEGGSLGIWQTWHSSCPEQETFVAQPEHLQERIGGGTDFWSIGSQATDMIVNSVGKYRRISEAERVLDWGCGCGRIISHMMRFVSPDRLFGCDIDGEAISWNAGHIHGPNFLHINPYPPTGYPSQFFDVVYGISVMTHLDEDTQRLWLEELARITRPHAILALSIIGDDLRATNMPEALNNVFQETGFATFLPSYAPMLAPFSTGDYYK